MISYLKSRWMLVLLLSLWGAACSTEITAPHTEPAKETAKPDPLKQPPPSVVTSGEVKIPEASVQSPNTPPESPVAGEVKSSSAPLEASKDRSDRACQIVLRTFHRVVEPTGTPKHHCQDGLCWWVFRATVDVAQAALDGQWQPRLLYRSTNTPDTWYELVGQPETGAATGFQRYSFTLQNNTIRDGISATAIQRSEVGAIPFLKHYAEGRLFDHNRLNDDFAHYQVNLANQWAIQEDASVCGQRPEATLVFDAGWQNTQHGAILAGGDLVVDYNLYRLTQCHGSTYMGQPTWNTLAYVRFLPSNQVVNAPLFDRVDANGAFIAKKARFTVPTGTNAVELWFSTSGRTCSPAWDSNFGNNYRFSVRSTAPAAVKWAGDWGNGLWRGCSHRPGLSEPVTVDSYILSRACHFIYADVYVPGLTDGSALNPQDIQAQVQFRTDDGELRTAWLRFVERTGNNYRYVWTFPASEMLHVYPNWQRYSFAFRFSTNGLSWFRIAQSDGPDGGAFRTIVRQY